MDSKDAIDNVKKIVKVAYDDTMGDNQIWTSTGTGIEAYTPYITTASIEIVKFKEPSLQRIYDKIIKVLELVETNTGHFSDDLEYVLWARDSFKRNDGYLSKDAFQQLNKLWKKYK
ncbi:MAG: hypothetical protein H8E03_00615 [Pelagibacteraceae bacterium]|nr:hypothetical protein [Pelagibacteraceae bacterium]